MRDYKDWLSDIDDAIVNAVLKVDRDKLRKYIRNWCTELNKNKNIGMNGLRPPRK